MKTKKEVTTVASKNDIEMAVARATRIMVDAGADFCVIGVDAANKFSSGMSPSFGAAVGRAEYRGNDEDGKFRFSYLVKTLETVANVLTGAEIDHRRRYGIPMTDTFDT